jgi:electron transfer flavoprotein alpha/beta subunit
VTIKKFSLINAYVREKKLINLGDQTEDADLLRLPYAVAAILNIKIFCRVKVILPYHSLKIVVRIPVGIVHDHNILTTLISKQK